jgi:hypothetical protein
MVLYLAQISYALLPTQLTCSSVEQQYFLWRCVWRSAVALVLAFTASGFSVHFAVGQRLFGRPALLAVWMAGGRGHVHLI